MNKLFLRIAAFLIFLAITIGGILFFKEGNTPELESNTKPQATVETGVGIGKKLLEFSLASLTGKEVAVRNTNKPLVINFFTTWCPPCRQEMPEIEQFVNKHKRAVTFYAVNIQESPEEVAKFMEKENYTFKEEVLLDKKADIAQKFRINSIPTTIIADKNGIIQYRKTGTVTLEELESILEKL